MLDELLVALGFDYDDEELQQFNAGYAAVVDTVAKLAVAATAGVAALTGLVVATSATADETGKLADEIGETVGAIDALIFAQDRTGGESSAMVGALRAISRHASETARGVGGAVESFGLLGVSVHDARGEIKSASTLITEVSLAMDGLDRGRQIDLADKLGLGGIIRLLQQGSSEITNLTNQARELGVTTEQDAAMASEFNDSLTNLGMIGAQVSRVLTGALSPTLTNITTKVVDWWRANREVIELRLPFYVDMLTKAFVVLSAATAAFIAVKLASTFVSLLSLIRASTIATLGLNAAVMLLPALLVGGAALLVALVEDAKVFFEGGESVIGDLIEKFPALESKLRIMAELLRGVYTIGKLIKTGWGEIFSMFENFSFDGLLEVFKNLPGFIGESLGLDLLKSNLVNNVAVPAQDTFNSSVNSSSQTNTTNRIDNVTINVNEATTPDRTAQVLQEAFQQASTDLFSPVDR